VRQVSTCHNSARSDGKTLEKENQHSRILARILDL